jgi:hypothetical protein
MASRFRHCPLLCALALTICLGGCKGLFGNQGLPRDPMFLDKKPVESKARYSPPVTFAYSEPVPPTHPSGPGPAYAGPPSAPPKSGPVPGTLTGRSRSEKVDGKEE